MNLGDQRTANVIETENKTQVIQVSGGFGDSVGMDDAMLQIAFNGE